MAPAQPSPHAPVPFWFINGAIGRAELTRQIEDIKAHGLGGHVFHPRLGLTCE